MGHQTLLAAMCIHKYKSSNCKYSQHYYCTNKLQHSNDAPIQGLFKPKTVGLAFNVVVELPHLAAVLFRVMQGSLP